jgi:hypothetical protein
MKAQIFILIFLPVFLFSFDLSVESIYLENLNCQVHFVLKNQGGTIPENEFSKIKVRLSLVSEKKKLSFSLNEIDPMKQLNSKKVLDFDTNYVLKKNERVEVFFENLKDNNSSNNRKIVDLDLKTCKAERESEKYPKRDYEEHFIDHSPFEKRFSFSINGISAPKSVYVYDAMPPNGPFKRLNFNWESTEPDYIGMKIEFLGKGDRVLKTYEYNTPRYGDCTYVLNEIMAFSDSTTRDGAFFKVKGTLKLKDGKYSQNSKIIRLWINLVNGHYYYQDWRTRGAQILKVNDSMGPVLISGITEDDREGNMNLSFTKTGACPSDYPIIKNIKIHFYTTSEDGSASPTPASYRIDLSENQTSYSFKMKDIIQSLGIGWSAKWYFISVKLEYDCSKQTSGSGINVEFPQHKEPNAVNIRFMAPQPLL